MDKYLTIQKQKIAYTLRRSKRSKNMKLAVYDDGSVIVTLPYRVREGVVEVFIKKNMKWLLKKISFYRQFGKIHSVSLGREDYLKNKEKARNIVSERVRYFNNIYGYSYKRISIKNQKTLWGSCSNKGNLNFNYKILFLPEELRDYVIVHELCHLGELNHSRRFWKLVSKTIPNYRDIRRELKRNRMMVTL